MDGIVRGALLGLFAWAAIAVAVFAQATNRAIGEVTCAADGSSTQVVAARGARLGLVITNTSDTDVRVANLTSGTADLDATNSFVLKAGQAFGDSVPSLYIGRWVCMSTSASTKVVGYQETFRP